MTKAVSSGNFQSNSPGVSTHWSLDGAERSEAERREDPTDVAWITASTSQADHLSVPSVVNYVIFNSWHSVDCKWFGCHFGQSADNDTSRRLFAVQVFSSYVSCGQFADLWRPRRHVP